MTDGFGAVTWWGFSPALDLQDEDEITALKKLQLTDKKHGELNILLVGAGDLRHVLMTVARSYRHSKRKLHFYVLENNLELYARDMLFTTIALEIQKRMGLQEKTELFLELFGNILVRKQSEEYVERMADEFIKMVTDLDYLEKKLPVLDLSQLKFKERDFLESIFKFWRTTDATVFPVVQCWDLRLRQNLGVRYDSRLNIYDWDYQMRLCQRDADIINVHEYKYWRNNGNAFEIREATYDVPNKTLASGLIIKHGGEKHARRGFWGDILVSPFIALGIECEEKSFFKKTNQVYTKTAQNVSEYNLLSIFHEIANREKYVPPEPPTENTEKVEENTPKLKEISEEEEEEGQKEEGESCKPEEDQGQEQQEPAPQDKKPLQEEFEALPLDDVKITFLPVNCLPDLPNKSKYKKLFDLIYFSNSMVHLFKPDVTGVFADQSAVILESARYMVELKLDKVKEFATKITSMAQAAGCQLAEEIDPEKVNFLKFTFDRDSR